MGQIKVQQVLNFGNVRTSRKIKKIDQGTPRNKPKLRLEVENNGKKDKITARRSPAMQEKIRKFEIEDKPKPEMEDKPKPEMTRNRKNKPQLYSESAKMTGHKKIEEATRNKQENCKKINDKPSMTFSQNLLEIKVEKEDRKSPPQAEIYVEKCVKKTSPRQMRNIEVKTF